MMNALFKPCIFRRMQFNISATYGCRYITKEKLKHSKFTNPNHKEYWTNHSWDHVPCGWFGLIREGKAFNEHSYVGDLGIDYMIPGYPASDEIEAYIDCNEGGRIYWIETTISTNVLTGRVENKKKYSTSDYIVWLNNRIYRGLPLPTDINVAMDAEIAQEQEAIQKEIAHEQEAIEKEIAEQKEQYKPHQMNFFLPRVISPRVFIFRAQSPR
eukprot:960708_1